LGYFLNHWRPSWNGNEPILGYFLPVFGTMTSEKAGNPIYVLHYSRKIHTITKKVLLNEALFYNVEMHSVMNDDGL